MLRLGASVRLVQDWLFCRSLAAPIRRLPRGPQIAWRLSAAENDWRVLILRVCLIRQPRQHGAPLLGPLQLTLAGRPGAADSYRHSGIVICRLGCQASQLLAFCLRDLPQRSCERLW